MENSTHNRRIYICNWAVLIASILACFSKFFDDYVWLVLTCVAGGILVLIAISDFRKLRLASIIAFITALAFYGFHV